MTSDPFGAKAQSWSIFYEYSKVDIKYILGFMFTFYCRCMKGYLDNVGQAVHFSEPLYGRCFWILLFHLVGSGEVKEGRVSCKPDRQCLCLRLIIFAKGGKSSKSVITGRADDTRSLVPQQSLHTAPILPIVVLLLREIGRSSDHRHNEIILRCAVNLSPK